MKISDLLTATADKLEKPGAWIQKRLAQDKHGNKASPLDPKATCWCFDGAMQSFNPHHIVFDGAILRLEDIIPMDHGIVAFNDDDDTTQTMVVDVCRRAAANALAEGL